MQGTGGIRAALGATLTIKAEAVRPAFVLERTVPNTADSPLSGIGLDGRD